MRGAKAVVLALRALGKTRKAAALAKGADSVPAIGEDLMGIGLVPDVPEDAVVNIELPLGLHPLADRSMPCRGDAFVANVWNSRMVRPVQWSWGHFTTDWPERTSHAGSQDHVHRKYLHAQGVACYRDCHDF